MVAQEAAAARRAEGAAIFVNRGVAHVHIHFICIISRSEGARFVSGGRKSIRKHLTHAASPHALAHALVVVVIEVVVMGVGGGELPSAATAGGVAAAATAASGGGSSSGGGGGARTSSYGAKR